MTARTGMANLITKVRSMAQAGTADYTIAGTSYWTDDQIEDVLDRYRIDVWREPLAYVETYLTGGTVQYKDYYSQYKDFEETTGGTAIFYLEDATGADIGTALYTPDYNSGRIAFAADTGGTAYFLVGRSYNLNFAAADIWRQKAGQYSAAVNFSTDNHRIDRGAIIGNCLRMSQFYESQAGGYAVEITRDDRNY